MAHVSVLCVGEVKDAACSAGENRAQSMQRLFRGSRARISPPTRRTMFRATSRNNSMTVPRTGEGDTLSAVDHVPDSEVAERHRRGKRQAGLVADTVLGGGGDIAGGVEARNGMTPLVDHLSSNVCQQADRRATSRMQLDAVERRLFDRSQAAIGARRGFLCPTSEVSPFRTQPRN
jgi:hypothetical protein